MGDDELLGKPEKCMGITCDGLASHPGGVAQIIILMGPVVQKPINANPGLTNNRGFNFSYINVVFHDNVLWSQN